MRSDQRDGEQHLGDEVAIAGGIERIRRDGAEAEGFFEEHTIHRETGAGERARAERQLGRATPGIGQALAIADERPGVGEEDVGPTHRLRALAVRIAGQDRVQPVLRFGDEGAAERGDSSVELVDRVQRPPT